MIRRLDDYLQPLARCHDVEATLGFLQRGEASNLGFKVAALIDCSAARPIVDQGWDPVREEEVRKAFFSTWQKAYARMTAAEALAELKAAV